MIQEGICGPFHQSQFESDLVSNRFDNIVPRNKVHLTSYVVRFHWMQSLTSFSAALIGIFWRLTVAFVTMCECNSFILWSAFFRSLVDLLWSICTLMKESEGVKRASMAFCCFSVKFCCTAFEISLCRRIQYFCWSVQRRLLFAHWVVGSNYDGASSGTCTMPLPRFMSGFSGCLLGRMASNFVCYIVPVQWIHDMI